MITLSLVSLLAMFGAMLALAVVPDASAMAVVARSMASGFGHGLMTVAGILAGDLIFILIAFHGLGAVAGIHGGSGLIKYLGAAYLCWLAFSLWRAPVPSTGRAASGASAWSSNFMCGLLITLADVKAILFYISFLPAFVDLTQATAIDGLLIMLTATLAVGGVKLGYAVLADRAAVLFRSAAARRCLNRIAAGVMLATALLLLRG